MRDEIEKRIKELFSELVQLKRSGSTDEKYKEEIRDEIFLLRGELDKVRRFR